MKESIEASPVREQGGTPFWKRGEVSTVVTWLIVIGLFVSALRYQEVSGVVGWHSRVRTNQRRVHEEIEAGHVELANLHRLGRFDRSR